jgi:hypothetical protein
MFPSVNLFEMPVTLTRRGCCLPVRARKHFWIACDEEFLLEGGRPTTGVTTSRFRHAQTGIDDDRHDRVIGDISAGLVAPPRLRRTGARCKALRTRNYFA